MNAMRIKQLDLTGTPEDCIQLLKSVFAPSAGDAVTWFTRMFNLIRVLDGVAADLHPDVIRWACRLFREAAVVMRRDNRQLRKRLGKGLPHPDVLVADLGRRFAAVERRYCAG